MTRFNPYVLPAKKPALPATARHDPVPAVADAAGAQAARDGGSVRRKETLQLGMVMQIKMALQRAQMLEVFCEF